MDNQELSFKNALAKGWELLRSQWRIWVSFFAIIIGLAVVEQLVGKLFESRAVLAVLGILFKLVNWYITFNALGVAVKLGQILG